MGFFLFSSTNYENDKYSLFVMQLIRNFRKTEWKRKFQNGLTKTCTLKNNTSIFGNIFITYLLYKLESTFTIIYILQGRDAAYSKTKLLFGKFSSVHYLQQTEHIIFLFASRTQSNSEINMFGLYIVEQNMKIQKLKLKL